MSDTDQAYDRGYQDGLNNRTMRKPESQPERAAYRRGYVAGQRTRRNDR